MIPYFVLLGIWIAGAIQFPSRNNTQYERILYVVAIIFTITMVGLRYRVGGDWYTYSDIYDGIVFQPLTTALSLTDPAYALINWLSARVDGQVYLVNLICAVIFVLGLSRLARKQPSPWLAMAVAIPYLVIVVGMGYTRQAVAIGIICWAISTSGQDSIWKTVSKVTIAALFHKTAVLFLPILLAPIAKRNMLNGIIGVIAFIVISIFTLSASSDNFISNYVNSNYQSGGASVRIVMNVVAAILFFVFRRHFKISNHDKTIWTVISVLSISCILGLILASSSVGVDRMALFFMPLQVFVYGNIPSTYVSRKPFVTATLAVLLYSAIVEYVYFFHGTYSYTWLPYRNAVTDNTDIDERIY